MPAFEKIVHYSDDGVELVEAADYAAMRELLDLVIGTDVQEYIQNLAANLLVASRASDAAAQFTAADKSWLQIADAAQTGLDPGADDVLCMGWFRVDSLTATRFIFDKRNTSSMQACTLHITTAGAVIGRIADGTSVSATSAGGAVAINTWYFIAYLADRSGNLDIYLGTEGVAPAVVATIDISAKVASDINSDGAFRVGTNNINDDYFDGRIDSLMFFKKADLSAVASDIIAWAYNNGAGRLCSEITAAQKALWGAISGWELGESTGRRYDSWGPNHLAESFAELTTNGTFTGNSTGWTEGAGWAYGTNNEVATAADANLTQTTVVPTIGKLYSTSFALTATTGSLRFTLGGVNGTTRSTTATHTETIRATSAATLVFDPVTTFTGVLDTVSVKAAEIRSAAGIHAADNRTRLDFTNPILNKEAPGAIGGTTPAAGSFTTVSATGAVSVVSDTVGVKLDAAGGTTIISNGTVVAINKPVQVTGTVRFPANTATINTTPSPNTCTVNLTAGNHWTIPASTADDSITATMTVPGSPCAGVIFIPQGVTPRDITWTPSAGTVAWVGTEPTWTDASEASEVHLVSWAWDGTYLYLSDAGKTSITA